ncbi:MAG: MerR family transcriptional regulator [Paracoccaceae bacterium]
MNIGEVAAISGLNPKTIRYYESRGLLQPLRSTNGYRSYRASDAQRLHLLAQARRLGLSLSDCETLLEMSEKRDAEPGVLTRLLQTHLDTLENEIRDLELKKAGVIELLARAAPDRKDDQPLLRLLSEQREDENRLQNAS